MRADLGKVFLAGDHAMDLACNDSVLNTQPMLDAKAAMTTFLRGNPDVTVAEARKKLDELLAKVIIEPEKLQPCANAVLAGEVSIRGGLDHVTEAMRDYLAAQPPQLSLAALFVRDATLSDYYVAKLLFGKDYHQVTVNANAQASWNKESATPAGTPLRRLRAYSVELGLNTKTMANGRIDGSVSAKGTRDEATDAKSLVIGEAKLNLHLTDTMRLPVTLTYANRETQTVKQGWQLNVGVSALLDATMRRLK
jgi:hypothetical protein